MYPNKENSLSRILAIDFGLKRIGLALTDPLLTFAYPFETINNDPKVFDKLDVIIKEKEVSEILLGFPGNDRQGKTSIINDLEKFKNRLEQKYKIKIVLWDESYTSVMAKRKVIESVTKKSRRKDKGLLDQNSAAIILQEYLELIREEKRIA